MDISEYTYNYILEFNKLLKRKMEVRPKVEKRQRSRSRGRAEAREPQGSEMTGRIINLPPTIPSYKERPWNNLTIGFDSINNAKITSEYLHDEILQLDPYGESFYNKLFWQAEEGEDAMWNIRRSDSQLESTVMIRRPHILMRIRNIKIWNKDKRDFNLTINDFDKDDADGDILLERHIEGQMDGGPRFGYLLPKRLRKFILSSHDKVVLPRAIFTVSSEANTTNYCMLNVEWKMYNGRTDEATNAEPINYNIELDSESEAESEGSDQLRRQDPAIIRVIDNFPESTINLSAPGSKTDENKTKTSNVAETFSGESLFDKMDNLRKSVKEAKYTPQKLRYESSTDLGSIPDVYELRNQLSEISIPEDVTKGQNKTKKQRIKVKKMEVHIDCELASQSSLNVFPPKGEE